MPDDAVRAVAELAASQHRALSRSQAADVNFSDRRIATAKRAGWLDEPTPGVLVVRGSPPTWRQRLMMVVLASAGRAVVSHRSAARLHGLDGFDSSRMAAVELSVQRSYRLRTADAVVHHVTPLDRDDTVTVDGLPCTGIVRTLADLGSVVRDRRRVSRALTSARRQGVGLRGLRDTAERLHRPGQAGTGTLLRLLDAVPFEGHVPDSWFEELLARCVDDARLPAVVPQYPICDAAGAIVARTDLGIPSVRLGLEAHSRRFHFGPESERLDEDRDLAAARCGWELLYLGWYSTRRPADVVRVVHDVVRARRRDLTRPRGGVDVGVGRSPAA